MYSTSAFSQTNSGDASNLVIYVLIGTAALILLGVVTMVGDNLVRIEAKQLGIDTAKNDFSILPKFGSLFGGSQLPAALSTESVHVFKRGYDLTLAGKADKAIDTETKATRYALNPQNFIGMSPIPKVTVEIGQEVKAGDIIFFDKKRPDVKYAAPVSGEITEVIRGEKRSIIGIVILADKEMQYRLYKPFPVEGASREELKVHLLENGLWPLIRQRPFDVVPDPADHPKCIYISTFDSAPLAPDLNLVVEGKAAAFQKGLDVLAKLTDGGVHIGLDARGEGKPHSAFTEVTGANKHWFKGPHPSGNVGVQIHHVCPMGTQDKIWVLGVQETIQLGTYFLEGKYDASRIVALTGPEFKTPRYVKTYQGANVENFLKDSLESDHNRVISGDVLSGTALPKDGFINFYDDQITVIKEGDNYELFGWLFPVTPRPSVSKTIPGFIARNLEFEVDTNTHGEKRAFVVTGQYEKVLPMDIYPQHLMKAILVNDYERMEGLGLHELSEEDIALCEFVCTSKQPLQKILREGLEMMREQG